MEDWRTALVKILLVSAEVLMH